MHRGKVEPFAAFIILLSFIRGLPIVGGQLKVKRELSGTKTSRYSHSTLSMSEASLSFAISPQRLSLCDLKFMIETKNKVKMYG